MAWINTYIDAHQRAIGSIQSDHVAALEQAIDMMASSISQGGRVLFCGNGGSAADCQHLAAELVVKLTVRRPALAAIALTTDTSALTAIGNDFGFDEIFSRQIEALGQAGDTLIAISTSGTSKNVVKAARTAQAQGLNIVAMTGSKLGPLSNLASITLMSPSQVTSHIQEIHIMYGHLLCLGVEAKLTRAALHTR